MEISIVTSVKDDFHEGVGPSTVTNVLLSIDGKLFDLGRFYEGPYMNDETSDRLKTLLEFRGRCNGLFI